METSLSKKYLVGIYDDEDVLLKAVKKARTSGVKIHEVYTPFPIHGLDTALGYKRTRLPIAAFMFGLTGTISAVTMISYMLGYDWPMIIGGKPFVPIPDLVPVSFEMTVLFAALGMVATFLITNNLWPGKTPLMFDSRSTDNKFVMAIDLSKNKLASDEITAILKNFGATEVNTKQVEIK